MDDPRALDADAVEVMARVARTFDLATRFLPREVRTDVRRLYLVLRTLDDLVDTGDPRAADAVTSLEAWSRGEPPRDRETRILEGLAAARPGFPRDAVADFAAGMRADLAGPAHATEADLDRYCYQVAGTVGRMMAAVLGVRDGEAGAADAGARALGAAMQRTNILRDLAEDGRAGRVYLPDDVLRDAGIDPADAAVRLSGFRSLPEATRRSILFGLVEWGDNGVGTAAQKAGIKRIKTVQTGGTDILWGIAYSEQQTIVTGTTHE